MQKQSEPNMVVHAYNPCTLEAKAEGSWVIQTLSQKNKRWRGGKEGKREKSSNQTSNRMIRVVFLEKTGYH
jgi:hypothetical protein